MGADGWLASSIDRFNTKYRCARSATNCSRMLVAQHERMVCTSSTSLVAVLSVLSKKDTSPSCSRPMRYPAKRRSFFSSDENGSSMMNLRINSSRDGLPPSKQRLFTGGRLEDMVRERVAGGWKSCWDHLLCRSGLYDGTVGRLNELNCGWNEKTRGRRREDHMTIHWTL